MNSYLGGDAATGTLTSPPFKVQRRYIQFLNGGKREGKSCMNLLLDGKVVRPPLDSMTAQAAANAWNA